MTATIGAVQNGNSFCDKKFHQVTTDLRGYRIKQLTRMEDNSKTTSRIPQFKDAKLILNQQVEPTQ
jgi:hypothetical protein